MKASFFLPAVTGREINEKELSRIGDRVFTLNRDIQLRDGRKGREDDVLSETYFIEREEPPADIFDIYNPERYLPVKGDKLISHKSKALDRGQVVKLMDEYYELRGWDVKTGFLKKETLERLDLSEVTDLLGNKVL